MECTDIYYLQIIAGEEIDRMSYPERCDILNKNPVPLARHFQCRVFFNKVITFDGFLGKTRYYTIRVEFQVRRSPHIHSFIWIFDYPN